MCIYTYSLKYICSEPKGIPHKLSALCAYINRIFTRNPLRRAAWTPNLARRVRSCDCIPSHLRVSRQLISHWSDLNLWHRRGNAGEWRDPYCVLRGWGTTQLRRLELKGVMGPGVVQESLRGFLATVIGLRGALHWWISSDMVPEVHIWHALHAYSMDADWK